MLACKEVSLTWQACSLRLLPESGRPVPACLVLASVPALLPLGRQC